MLNPRNDRLDYGQILAPPPGCCLDFAVGTTYSLDLDALVGASLAMGLSEETDSTLADNPVFLLEALRSVGDKVALFTEAGQIHMPGKVTSLYILLEKMVFSVQTKKRRKNSIFPSFHPKFWLLRYTDNSGEIIYRVIILSRNLTFDRSWDVTYCMDGYESDYISDKNEPICDFLRYLLKQLPDDANAKAKAKAIRAMIRELPSVEFEPPEQEFRDFEFIPNGIKRSEGGYYRFDETELFTNTFHEIAIISPFISGSIIRDFNDRNDNSPIQDPQYMLITREASLGKLKPEDVSNFKIYTMRDSVIDGESAISEEQTAAVQRQDIHAKIYMFLKYSNADLYLGSLNASHKAVYDNIEFMIRLNAKKRNLNMDKLKQSLFGTDPDGSDNPFQEITLKTALIDDDDKQDDLNTIIREISRSNPTAFVKEAEDLYDIRVSFGECDTKGYKVTIQPLLSNKKEVFGKSVIFNGLSITKLSEFYVVSVSKGERTIERILIIPTEGLPADREKAVVSSVVNDKDCFYRYISFLLGDNTILTAIEASISKDGTRNKSRQTYNIPALYEKMLQTAAINPEKFEGIDYLIKTINDDGIIPEDFEILYKTFKKAVNNG